MLKRLLIIGAGGHGIVAADCAENMRIYDEIVFLDNSWNERSKNGVWHIIDSPQNYHRYLNDAADFFVAIGDNQQRKAWIDILRQKSARITTLIHPSAVVSTYASIDQGSIICAQAVVNPYTKIGVGCVINTAATVDHDCDVQDFVHIAPGSNIAGIVSIGRLAFIGVGSCVIQSVKVGQNTLIGAGSVVTSNMDDNITAVGVPAKRIKDRK